MVYYNGTIQQMLDRFWEKPRSGPEARSVEELVSELCDGWSDHEMDTVAKFAAVPHIVRLARSTESQEERLELAVLLGKIALSAFDRKCRAFNDPNEVGLWGMPHTLDGWSRLRESRRNMFQWMEEKEDWSGVHAALRQWRESLPTGPIDESDLEKIEDIRNGFLDALPDIRALCRQACLENPRYPGWVEHLLAGMAASEGLPGLARFLEIGPEGWLRCTACNQSYAYHWFDEEFAIYAQDSGNGVPDSDRFPTRQTLADVREGVPSGADGVLAPSGKHEIASDDRVAALQELALQSGFRWAVPMLLNFLGHFICPKCGTEQSVAGCPCGAFHIRSDPR